MRRHRPRRRSDLGAFRCRTYRTSCRSNLLESEYRSHSSSPPRLTNPQVIFVPGGRGKKKIDDQTGEELTEESGDRLTTHVSYKWAHMGWAEYFYFI